MRQLVFIKEIEKVLNKDTRIKVVLKGIIKKVGLYDVVLYFVRKSLHFFSNNVNPQMLNFFSQYIGKDDLYFDIGAWNGDYIDTFLKLGSKIIAVEPQEKCIKILKTLYGKNKNIKIIWGAVGESIGKGEIYISTISRQTSTLSSRFIKESRFAGEREWIKKEVVSLITLDLLIKFYGIPKFCKIDVEGYEESVFKGLTHPISLISFEFHKELLDDVKKCCNHLNNLGKFEFNYSSGANFNSDYKLMLEEWISSEALYRELESKSDKDLEGDIYAKLI